MDDEVLARLAPLVGVVQAGVHERLLHPLAVDGHGGLVGVLLDDGEQVGQESLLDLRQLRARDGPSTTAMGHLVYRSPRAGHQRARAPTRAPAAGTGPGGSAQPAGWRLALLRNSRPSWYRLA